MEVSLLIARSLEQTIDQIIRDNQELQKLLGDSFDPIIRAADPKFGDFQINGILPLAKQLGSNPRALAMTLLEAIESSQQIHKHYLTFEIAGPGFINIRLNKSLLSEWIQIHHSENVIKNETKHWFKTQKAVIDFPSANTAKQAHIGHLRPMVIGEAIARMLEFCGTKLIRDNHIGDWGTNFGTLIMVLKRNKIDISKFEDPEKALIEIDRLYKEGSHLEKMDPSLRDTSRNELLLLQKGDPTNIQLWQSIVQVSNQAFDHLFEQLGVRTDYTLGESFYRDKVDRIYQELSELGIAEESEGALVVWHDEVKKFSRDNKQPFPFNIRKKDGASNYASTDLATVLYRLEHFDAESVIYLTDSRQQDHFQQLFLTTNKWFSQKGYSVPELKHVWWGTILGSDNKPFKTKSGETIKLQALIDEAVERAYSVVSQKNPNLEEKEKQKIAQAVGIGALKYADLSSNRTQDYVFDWDRMLSFEGNTAPYLLYVIARINSIFKKANRQEQSIHTDTSFSIETEYEQTLARKFIQFPIALEQALSDLRPHFLCTYLFELAGTFNTFYNHEKVIHEDMEIQTRRIILCHRTQLILELGLTILGIDTVEHM
ncbi:MAG: arginine--tRNA ligase [Coraliomargaritaceae bacterium]